MTSIARASAPVHSEVPHQEGYRRKALLVLIWLLASLIAAFFALLTSDSAYVDGQYIPLTNDSFYHARRILDAAFGEHGFYQFDERIHVPDGTWIPWAWGYDFLIAKLTQVWLWVWPQTDPMAPMSFVSFAVIPVNCALFLAAASAFGLSMSMRVVAMLAFALSPFTQFQHSIGMIDHHVVEFTFVLLSLFLGARWFKDSADAGRAAVLGGALGLAHAVHNGLFLLQLAPLVCIFMLWMRGNEPPGKASLLSAYRYSHARLSSQRPPSPCMPACSSSRCFPGFTSTSRCARRSVSRTWHGSRIPGSNLQV